MSQLTNSVFLAQLVHIFATATAIYGAVAYGFPAWTGAAAVLVIAVIKETLIDPLPQVEGNPFWNGTWNCGLVDLSFYAAAALVILMAWTWLPH